MESVIQDTKIHVYSNCKQFIPGELRFSDRRALLFMILNEYLYYSFETEEKDELVSNTEVIELVLYTTWAWFSGLEVNRSQK